MSTPTSKPSSLQIVKLLTTKGYGRRWTKSESLDRVYLTANAIELIGLSVSTYGSGNISGAALNGEKVSNTYAGELARAIQNAWFDVPTGRWYSKERKIDDAFALLIPAINERALAA